MRDAILPSVRTGPIHQWLEKRFGMGSESMHRKLFHAGQAGSKRSLKRVALSIWAMALLTCVNPIDSEVALAADTFAWDTGSAGLFHIGADFEPSSGDQFATFTYTDSYPTASDISGLWVDGEGRSAVSFTLTTKYPLSDTVNTVANPNYNIHRWRDEPAPWNGELIRIGTFNNNVIGSWYLTTDTNLRCGSNKCIRARFSRTHYNSAYKQTPTDKVGTVTLTIRGQSLTVNTHYNLTGATLSWDSTVTTNSDGNPEYTIGSIPGSLASSGISSAMATVPTTITGLTNVSTSAKVTETVNGDFLRSSSTATTSMNTGRGKTWNSYNSDGLVAGAWLVATDNSYVEFRYGGTLSQSDDLLWGGTLVTTFSVELSADFNSNNQVVDELSLSVVFKKPKLELSIAADTAASTSVDEGGDVTFAVEAGSRPVQNLTGTGLDIHYSVSFIQNNTNSGSYNYLSPDLGTGITICDPGPPNQRCGEFLFRSGSGNNKWTTTITIKTKMPDSVDHGGGTVRVILLLTDQTAPKSGSDSAETLVRDTSAPQEFTISIKALVQGMVSDTAMITEGGDAVFRIFSNVNPDRVVSIRYRANSTSAGGYVYMVVTSERPNNAFIMQNFDFTAIPGDSDGRYFADLIIPTNVVDDNDRGGGSIAVTLDTTANQMEEGVTVDAANSRATVTVTDAGANATHGLRMYTIRSLDPHVVEGKLVRFQIESNLNPGGTDTITIRIDFEATASDTSASNYLSNGVGQRTLSFSSNPFAEAGTTGRYVANYNLPPTAADGVDRGGGTVTVTLVAATNGRLGGMNSATVTIVDSSDSVAGQLRDRPLVNLDLTAAGSVTEGERWVTTVTVTSAPAESMEVMVGLMQEGDFVTFAPPRLAFERGQTQAELEVHTNDDLVDEDHGSFTVTILTDLTTWYGAGANISATVTVRDNDQPNQTGTRFSVAGAALRGILAGSAESATGLPVVGDGGSRMPIVSISADQAVIAEEQAATFRVVANSATATRLLVQVELSAAAGLVAGELDRTVALEPYWSETTFTVQTTDDGIPEVDGTVTATIVEGDDYAVATRRATVRVADDKDRADHNRRAVAANNAITPLVLAAMSGRSTAAVGERVGLAFSGSDRTTFELGGESTVTGVIVAGGRELNGDGYDLKSKLANSSFAINLFPEEGSPGAATIWGIGANGTLSNGSGANKAAWKGGMYIGQLGFDARLGRELLVGTATSLLSVDLVYGDLEDTGLDYSSRFTGIHPYLGYVSTSGKSRLQMTTGYGVGELGINHPQQDPVRHASNYQVIGLDGSQQIHSGRSTVGGRYQLHLAGELLFASQSAVESVDFAAGLRTRMTQFQLAVELDHEQILSASKLTPTLAVGMRGHSVNDNSLTGTHLAAGFEFSNSSGLQVSSSGRMLIDDGIEPGQLALSSALEIGPHPDNTGYHLSVSADWMRDRLSGRQPNFWSSPEVESTLFSNAGLQDGLRAELEFNYGIAVMDESGVLIPGVGLDFKQARLDGFRMGSQLVRGADAHVEVTMFQQLGVRSPNRPGLRMGGSYRW